MVGCGPYIQTEVRMVDLIYRLRCEWWGVGLVYRLRCEWWALYTD